LYSSVQAECFISIGSWKRKTLDQFEFRNGWNEKERHLNVFSKYRLLVVCQSAEDCGSASFHISSKRTLDVPRKLFHVSLSLQADRKGMFTCAWDVAAELHQVISESGNVDI
jgi:hypothetical protein